MDPIWYIKDSYLDQFAGDGKGFSDFMNVLLRAAACSAGLRNEQADTNHRVNDPDGGVDAAIHGAVAGDNTGWLGCPTVWQFKAKERNGTGKAKLLEEINKPYVRKLIGDGYGYRFAICGGMTPKKVAEWEKILGEETMNINKGAPPPRVLAADKLAAWANRFPAICAGFFPGGLRGVDFLAFQGWRDEARRIVPHYIVVDGLQPAIQGIAAFARLGHQVNQPCLTVQGAAGAGKTRLVCEALASPGDAAPLVLYTRDEGAAIRLAEQVARREDCAAIIVADECGPEARARIWRALEGHTARARAICIDNSARRPPTGGAEIVIEKPPPEAVERIIQRNFGGIDPVLVRAITHLCRGFIRLAVDMCQNVHLLGNDVGFGTTPSLILDLYIEGRLGPDHRRALFAISLLPRVGFRDEVRGELESLESICGMAKGELLRQARSMKDAPGFVAFAWRYIYVTPQIIAAAAFQAAWREHIGGDLQGFVGRLPEAFIDRFQAQVQECGTVEMRQEVSKRFGQWVSQMTQEDLAESGKVRRLIQLVELQPEDEDEDEDYLLSLKRLVVGTPVDELRRLHAPAGFGRGPRRELVWFCERAMAFPEYLRDIEEILFHLALAESEPTLGNNATRIWQQIFRPSLSGTAAPFKDRVMMLRDRLSSGDEAAVRLVTLAIDEILASLRGVGMRMVGPPVVMGRIPPPEWRPGSEAELGDCWRLLVELLAECASSKNQNLSLAAKRAAVGSLQALLAAGFLADLKGILRADELPEELLPKLLEGIDFLLTHEPPGRELPADTKAQIGEWRASLAPKDFRLRLLAAVGQQAIHRYNEADDSPWHTELSALASEMVSDGAVLRENLEWLFSDAARSAWDFGLALGKLDTGATLIDTIVGALVKYHRAVFALGYLNGLLAVSPGLGAEKLAEQLDAMEAESPPDAFQLAVAGGDLVGGFDRVARLVESGRLGPEYMGAFDVGTRDTQGKVRRLTTAEVKRALRLFSQASAGSGVASRAGAHFLWSQTMPPAGIGAEAIFGDPEMRAFAERVLAAAAARADYYWREAMVRLIPFAPRFVVGTSVGALFNGGPHVVMEAEAALAAALPEHADAVLAELTSFALDRKAKWRLRTLKFAELVGRLPGPAVGRWLDEVGVEGARGLARSLPAPRLGDDGTPIVPEPTLTVLRRFGDDEEVLNEFCLGVHSFQMYSGDISGQHEREAKVAQAFLGHDLKAVRLWAGRELKESKERAAQERQRAEEEESGF